MDITRDNYEMYFLMYVDNELSAAERNVVDVFIKENNDLAAELELLQGTRLSSDEMIFVPKTLLYRNVTAIESVQQSLLLHLDNELPAADATSLRSQIASDTTVEAEWNILQKTKLDPKYKIIFNNKALLYRHTDNVITIRFWRAAVAAILIGAGLFVGVSLYNKDVPSDKVATNKDGGKQNGIPAPVIVPSNNNGKVKDDIAITNRNDHRPPTTDHRSTAAVEENVHTTKNKDKAKNNIVIVKKNDLKNPALKNINKDERNETAIQSVKEKEDRADVNKKNKVNKVNEVQRGTPTEDIAVAPPSKIKEMARPVIVDTDISDVKQNYARLAVNDETSNDHILYMQEDKVTRSKLGGFIRKVKRVVERNTKIKTSNGLRIGGFEFAVK